MLATTQAIPLQCRFLSSESAPMKPVIENFIHSFGGVSYDTGELLLAKFANGQSAEECAAEIGYLYQTIPLEVDGEWMAVYLA
jgi:hypothetical protein